MYVYARRRIRAEDGLAAGEAQVGLGRPSFLPAAVATAQPSFTRSHLLSHTPRFASCQSLSGVFVWLRVVKEKGVRSIRSESKQ